MDVSPQDHSKYILVEDTPEPTLDDTTPPMEEETTLQAPCKDPQISLHALSGFSVPKTLKLSGCIKHRKVIILIDNDNTHDFIHRRVAKETPCYVHAIPNFQIMIINGSMMNCGGKCKNVKLQIDEYHVKSHMFSIEMGGCDVVLMEEW
jgi:hypothetical protein